ncbi:MAG: GNAT family N-acetyltransferase [Micavibrio sp.]|nr:GNAT family N-acetyltransferase [Micavibrio sp.]
MNITYQLEPDLTAEDFRQVLMATSLGARRPVDNLPRLHDMLRNASLIVTARENGRIVGVSRAMTDFAFCCYLSDLAVDETVQRQGIGKKLIDETKRHAGGDNIMLLLLAAPDAETYYPKIGMTHMPACWAIKRAG